MEGLILNSKEQRRLQVLNMVLGGVCQVAEAARVLGLSERHLWRLLSAYRKEGARALAHGNRGREPATTLPQEVREKVVELACSDYKGLNHCHLTDLLAEREGIQLSRSSLRRILASAGLKSPRHRRQPKHRCRRERYPQEGMLLQIDGSRHDWLEGRGHYLTLVGAVDDATGTVPYALFREQEDAQGYFWLLREVIRTKGIPLAVYSDRHGIFQRSPKDPDSLEEQLSGQRQPTQFGRALQELGIQPLFALSPQAKGRVERLWGTFQDRLVAELRLAGASTPEEANRVLWAFLLRFNARFGVPASYPGSAYRPPSPDLCLDGVLCFKYQRTVSRDNTIRWAVHTLQLLPGLDRASYTHAKVELQERLDGSLVVLYQGQTIASQPAPKSPVTLRARKIDRASSSVPESPLGGELVSPHLSNPCSHHTPDQLKDLVPASISRKPAPDHPWRKPLLTKSLNI